MNHQLAEALAYGLAIVFTLLGVIQAGDDQWVAAVTLWGFAGWSWLMAERMGEGGT